MKLYKHCVHIQRGENKCKCFTVWIVKLKEKIYNQTKSLFFCAPHHITGGIG